MSLFQIYCSLFGVYLSYKKYMMELLTSCWGISPFPVSMLNLKCRGDNVIRLRASTCLSKSYANMKCLV